MKNIITSLSVRVVLCSAALWTSAYAEHIDDRLRHHWDYDRSAPLNIQQVGTQDREGVAVFDISYSSPVGDRATFVGPEGGLVTAYLVVPPGDGPFPAIIYGHWCMPGSEKKNRTEFLDEAVVMAHSGVISLLPDHVIVHPGFEEDPSLLNEQQVQVEVQQDVNLRRGADLLLARKDVDAGHLAYVGHSCDANAGAFLSGIDQRFKAFVLMSGNLSYKVDLTTRTMQEFRRKVGPKVFDAFAAKFSWTDPAKYVSHAAPAAMFLQYETESPFLMADMPKRYFVGVSSPKRLRVYKAPHALNAEATRDRIAFLARQLAVPLPAATSIAGIPPLVQPPWPKD